MARTSGSNQLQETQHAKNVITNTSQKCGMTHGLFHHTTTDSTRNVDIIVDKSPM
jgi:hypothetical protein